MRPSTALLAGCACDKHAPHQLPVCATCPLSCSAGLHHAADAILRDVGKLDRAWRAYQRTYTVPNAGQLDLFASPAAP